MRDPKVEFVEEVSHATTFPERAPALPQAATNLHVSTREARTRRPFAALHCRRYPFRAKRGQKRLFDDDHLFDVSGLVPITSTTEGVDRDWSPNRSTAKRTVLVSPSSLAAADLMNSHGSRMASSSGWPVDSEAGNGKIGRGGCNAMDQSAAVDP